MSELEKLKSTAYDLMFEINKKTLQLQQLHEQIAAIELQQNQEQETT